MNFQNHLIDAGRISCWRKPLCSEARFSPISALLIFALVAVMAAVGQFFQSDGVGSFSFYGINSIIASTVGDFAVILLFARVDRVPATFRNLILLYLVIAGTGLIAAQMFVAAKSFMVGTWVGSTATKTALVIGIAETIVVVLWKSGAARQVFKSVRVVRYPSLRAFAFVLCLFLVEALLPHWPVFRPKEFDSTTANFWEVADLILANREAASNKYAEEERELEQKDAGIEGRQPALLDAALASVKARDADKSNVFLIGLAGYGAQDVFERETRHSVEILMSRFSIGKRVVQLVNADDATDHDPVASIQNLAFILRGIGARMDHEQDVLMLTMTSHGSQNGFALSFGGLIYRTLDPATLKHLLDDAGIKNRILIVSACYSGAFVPILANDDTMIMTAASSTRTSFGCANGRDWTYFGDALFAHGLKTEPTLAGAFVVARKTISQWEKQQNLTPSDPQIFVGKAIARRFPQLVGGGPQNAWTPDETALNGGEPARTAN